MSTHSMVYPALNYRILVSLRGCQDERGVPNRNNRESESDRSCARIDVVGDSECIIERGVGQFNGEGIARLQVNLHR